MKAGLLKGIGEGIKTFAENNGRVVGGVIAVAGVIGTAILAYQARPKVDKVLEEKKEKVREIEADESLTEEEKAAEKKAVTKETAKELIPEVAPAVVCGIVTVGTIIATLVSAEKAINHWSGLAVAGDIAYKELYDKTRDIVGEEKANEIRKEIIEDQNKDVKFEECMIYDCGGPELFYDALSGRLFRASESIVNKAVLNCNMRLTAGSENYITVNEFYDELGLPHCILGEDRAWGGFTPTDKLEPNMFNTMRHGEGSAVILDWFVRPMLGYR